MVTLAGSDLFLGPCTACGQDIPRPWQDSSTAKEISLFNFICSFDTVGDLASKYPGKMALLVWIAQMISSTFSFSNAAFVGSFPQLQSLCEYWHIPAFYIQTDPLDIEITAIPPNRAFFRPNAHPFLLDFDSLGSPHEGVPCPGYHLFVVLMGIFLGLGL